MDQVPARLSRRSACALLAAAGLTARPAGGAQAETALAAPMPEAQPTIAVAGPQDSEVAHWAALLRPHLAAGLRPRVSARLRPHHLAAVLMAGRGLRLRFVGGQDGVTGANQFDARAMPDGQEALLLPGSAALAWLAGDSRVRFDAARLLPLLVSASTGVLVMRGGAAGLPAGRTLRVACAAPVAPALTALMAFDLLGTAATPVMTGGDLPGAARRGEVDAAFVHGLGLPDMLPALASAGLQASFAVTFPGLQPASFAGLPDLYAMLAASSRATQTLLTAWRAVAAASLMDAALALPRLCPAGTVAQWRQACEATQAAPSVLPDTVAGSVRLLAGPACETAVAQIFVDPPAQLALRRWLGARLNWRPT